VAHYEALCPAALLGRLQAAGFRAIHVANPVDSHSEDNLSSLPRLRSEPGSSHSSLPPRPGPRLASAAAAAPAHSADDQEPSSGVCSSASAHTIPEGEPSGPKSNGRPPPPGAQRSEKALGRPAPPRGGSDSDLDVQRRSGGGARAHRVIVVPPHTMDGHIKALLRAWCSHDTSSAGCVTLRDIATITTGTLWVD
jgi:hypothetical protein